MYIYMVWYKNVAEMDSNWMIPPLEFAQWITVPFAICSDHSDDTPISANQNILEATIFLGTDKDMSVLQYE